MAKEPIQAPREKTEQPDAGETRKDQKGFQLPMEFDARLVNQEFDRLHSRLNALLVEAAALTDLDEGGAVSNADICTRINALAEIMRQASLLRRSE
jgi:hypothetical protein